MIQSNTVSPYEPATFQTSSIILTSAWEVNVKSESEALVCLLENFKHSPGSPYNLDQSKPSSQMAPLFPMGPWSKAVHYIGARVLLGTHLQPSCLRPCGLVLAKVG